MKYIMNATMYIKYYTIIYVYVYLCIKGYIMFIYPMFIIP